MSTVTELQNRVDVLESILRERERKEAEDKAAALAAQEATDAAKSAEERATAATEEKQRVRRGTFINFYLSQQPPDAPVDFAALDAQVPAEGWPPGSDESQYVFATGGASPKAEEALSQTTLGKALAALTRHI